MNHKALLALAMVLASPPVLPDGPQEPSKEIAGLLSDAKNAASSVNSDIATLDLVARAGQRQATVLNLYESDIAALRAQADKLEALQAQGSRAQQTAIGRMVPIMQEFVSTAAAALNAASAANASTEYFRLNSALSGEFAALISGWADYAKTRDELAHIAPAR